MEPKYEEQFTAFVDFLGFREISTQTDDATRLKVLNLLLALSALRGEFDVQTTAQETSKTSSVKPAISTFSDHIVISYPLQPIYADTGFSEQVAGIVVLRQFGILLTSIAAAALRIGFLVRGAATIGKLYHARGVVFGEALVEAYELESHTSVYPRIVLSPKLTSRSAWIDNQMGIAKDNDGLYHFDYFMSLVLHAASPGNDWGTNVKAWFDEAVQLVTRKLNELQGAGKLNELAKWGWFARQFREGLQRMNPQLLKSLSISLDAISW
jgi:hypothetical protein